MTEMGYYDQVQEAADAIRSRVPTLPEIAIVLGSGLGDFANSLGGATTMPYAELPHWPASRVIGHSGKLVVGTVRGRTIAALAGRSHMYEGHDAGRVAFPVRALGLLGVKTLILTNAAGGVNTGFAQGALMVIDDHINLMGHNPLVGENDERFGPRFPDMTEIYSSRLRGIADRAGQAIQLSLPHGTYVALLGPSYETPAEIRYLRTIGAGRRRHVDGPRGDCGSAHANGSARDLVHHQHGGGRAAQAAGPRRGYGHGGAGPRAIHRVAGGHH
jgi:purine-nucleoside phosphorylase